MPPTQPSTRRKHLSEPFKQYNGICPYTEFKSNTALDKITDIFKVDSAKIPSVINL